MTKQSTNQKPKHFSIANILVIVVLVFAISLIWIRYWELNWEINLLSGNISEIINYQKQDLIDQEEQDDSDEQKQDDEQDSQDVIIPKLKLALKSAGYYYSVQGDQLGIGPLPPMVDVQTNYWIFWEIEDFNNNLESFSISAQIPENVVWTNNKTVLAGKLSFGQIGQRVVWSIDQIEKGAGVYRVGFEIGLIPTQADLGQILNLLTDVEYQAKDEFGQEVSGQLNNITTDLIFDELASGKGEVVPLE